MVERTLKIIVVLLIFCWPMISLGQNFPKTRKIGDNFVLEKRKVTPFLVINLSCWGQPTLNTLTSNPMVFIDYTNPEALHYIFKLPSAYYINHVGFFCKQELKIQKITSLPVFFRLGSHDYVNWLEQKPNAHR